MLEFTGEGLARCDGVSRRSLLKVGGLGLGGLTLPAILRRRAEAKQQGDSLPETSVIFVDLDGGPSQFETYDPKPNAPAEYRGEFGVVGTSLAGVHFSELIAEQAKVMDKVAIIRTISHNSTGHGTSAHLTQTGYYHRNPLSSGNDMPAVGALVKRLKGGRVAGLPPYVSVGMPMRYGEAAYLGKGYNPFIAKGDPSRKDFKVHNLALNKEMDASRLSDRCRLLSELDRHRRLLDREGVSKSIDRFNAAAFDLVSGGRAQAAFDINQEKPKTRDRYGRTAIGQSLLLARRLIEAGVTFVTARHINWDDHGNIAQRRRMFTPDYDRGVAALVSDLYDRGLDRDVLLVVTGEFGRTPRINHSAGRDHWGALMSILIAGGGLKVGQVVGRSSAKGEVPVENPYRPENVLAMVYRHLGIDPSTKLEDHSGRPRYVLERRGLIGELV